MQGFLDESVLKSFIKIALSCAASKINAFLRFTQKFKMMGKCLLGKVTSRFCIYPMGQKFCQNRSISLRFRDKCVFVFNTEF